MTKAKMSFHVTIIIILSVRLGSDESTSTGCPVKYIVFRTYSQSRFLFIFSHYRTILSCRSDVKVSDTGGLFWFSSNNSGIAKRTRSISASNEPDSSTRPGMSLLVTIHTSTSLSHVKFTTYSINTSYNKRRSGLIISFSLSLSQSFSLFQHKSIRVTERTSGYPYYIHNPSNAK